MANFQTLTEALILIVCPLETSEQNVADGAIVFGLYFFKKHVSECFHKKFSALK